MPYKSSEQSKKKTQKEVEDTIVLHTEETEKVATVTCGRGTFLLVKFRKIGTATRATATKNKTHTQREKERCNCNQNAKAIDRQKDWAKKNLK